MSKFLLTIAIPTFNREKPLEHTLSIVLPQVLSHEDVQLLVLDNASKVPAEMVLQRVAGACLLPERVRVIRHSVNIGGNANILRCFEAADGEWLWCLGDDDEPSRSAVGTILKDVAGARFCYAFYGYGGASYEGCGIEEWVDRVPSYGQRLFLSQSLFRVPVVRKYFTEAYIVAASGAAHLAMAFLSIVNGGAYFLSNGMLAEYRRPESGNGYNCVPLAYGSSALLILASDEKRYAQWKMFFKNSFPVWVSPYLLLYQVISYHKTTSSSIVSECFKCISRNFKPKLFSRYAVAWFRWTLCSIMSKMPCVYLSLVRLRERLKNRRYERGDLSRVG